jgi:hypothetical protein
MKRCWLFALPAVALLLGSATPPNMLSYDLAGLVGSGPECAVRISAGCSVLRSRREDIAEARRRQLLLEAELRAKAEALAAARAAIDAGLKLVISIPQQKMYVFRNGELLTTSRVSTGKRGYATPVGTFEILQKKVRHNSNLYDDAPMPYMQRLTFGGVALHAGSVPGYPASHGCIRLPWGFARTLYGMTDWTTRVTVSRDRPQTAEDALELIRPSDASVTPADFALPS